MDNDVCLNCDAVLEGIVDSCPKCATRIVYCAKPSCGRAIIATAKFCPFCQQANLEYEPAAPPPAPEAKAVSVSEVNPLLPTSALAVSAPAAELPGEVLPPEHALHVPIEALEQMAVPGPVLPAANALISVPSPDLGALVQSAPLMGLLR